ncbi:MAG TPA: 3-dehydroquinate synthase family protein [Treponemataceae bacterium]|nr:3-dehydroquinate synthase family protein [Treponemataceae bacterium]
MDIFKFSVSTGEVSILFHNQITVPSIPSSGGIYIVDTNTYPLLQKALGYSPEAPLVILPCGESEKNFTSIEKILKAALQTSLGRDSLFVGFGGGVVTDMTAFAASLYMRGARLELVPTTLLAMADAAVGGKTGIDYENFKNSIGTFYPADKIHISISALKTLSETEFRSGLAEVIKTALLYDSELFSIMKEKKEGILARDPSLLLDIVSRCVIAKARVVERDLRESGERMFLNLGHTFGHALESVAGFGRIPHGDAVAWGIARAFELGIKMNVTDATYKAEVIPVLESYGWSTAPVHPVIQSDINSGLFDKTKIPQLLLSAMKNDKKKKDGNIRFILQRKMNETLVTEVSDPKVLEVLL